MGMGMLLITHDLGVVAETADRVAVMYAGRIVEEAPVGKLFSEPAHPYTRGLLASVPRLGDRKPRLRAIPGTVPDAHDFPAGCRFRTRCPDATETCKTEPQKKEISNGHTIFCHNKKGITV
jgi:oligopeptide/dipeptide ABC transporter ATP-binding protein